MKLFKTTTTFSYLSSKTNKETTGKKTCFLAISEKSAIFEEYKDFTNNFEDMETFKKLAISDNLLEYDTEEKKYISNCRDMKYKEVVDTRDIKKKK